MQSPGPQYTSGALQYSQPLDIRKALEGSTGQINRQIRLYCLQGMLIPKVSDRHS